ncbi:GH92 family glycosyl hydrolase [Flammeovirga yaeyamensis]|uniref:GH92 family glycosyl hydrolase n=1 Tax=Flammeovirga yaeyamensis TaxID=367791 RepID=A0AAX1N2T9_9BACT|nr:GH92 family glycosyl hydrolase [Flammeovirga yaeyamensis]MBB3696261.1 putative alpha-1,2-mannosidase [Flammeovirga yaeyamensis]NMF34942.1 glycoside hydrolase family 92 protein [Flammeovirga yaeyamensis]QWG00233.1 GH92 family glycosyl hydrolase [Flammeovirga yaeyamensis]
MRKVFITISLIPLLFSCVSQLNQKASKEVLPKSNSEFVDPFIGTSAHGHTFPGATVPFGMVQLSPDTGIEGWDWCSGYHSSDNSIMGFSHTHLSGTGGGDYGDILLMPAVGDVKTEAGSKKNPDEGYRSRFEKVKEEASPGFYSVFLEDYDITAELTATTRVGVHQYHFPASDNAHIILDLKHGISDSARETWFEVTSDNEIVGLRRSSGWARDQYVYFVAQFSKPFKSVQGIKSGMQLTETKKLDGEDVKAVINYTTEEGEAIVVNVAISGVSVEGARKNLEAEVQGFDFNKVREQAKQTWDQKLSKIQVEGGDQVNKTIFYTALYHSLIAPNVYMDVDHQYRGMDHKIHKAEGFTHYTLFSLWDTFRATHPLFTLIAPEENNDFIQSMLVKYEQSGQLPVWELSANETGTMIGFHSAPVIADAILKGQAKFDKELAYKAMVAAAEDPRRGLNWFNEEGFIPVEKEANAVSKGVEYAYDMWVVAQVAKELGKMDDYKKYSNRALNYKQLFDKNTGFLRGKNMYGAWDEPFDPMAISLLGAGNYTEGNAWHYNFFAPQDINGLIDLHGGDQKFIDKIDHMFKQEAVNDNHMAHDVTGLIGQYAQGNEPSHHVIYLYNYAGEPWKTQSRIRQVMDEMYTSERDGLCGNEDCGQMSAWYVFSAMGFYPVNPADGNYAIGSPIFGKVTIHLDNGNDFVITADQSSPTNEYIQSAAFDGQAYNKTYITHDQIEKGGILSFKMGENKSNWGAEVAARPTSHAIPLDEVESILETKEVVYRPYVTNSSVIFNGETTVEFKDVTPNVSIYYTLDGSIPTATSPKFSEAFTLNQSTLVKAIAIDPNGVSSKVSKFAFKKAFYNTGGEFPKLSINYEKNATYDAGENGILNGIYASDNLRDGKWDGVSGQNFEVVIDLGKDEELHQVSIGFLENTSSWVFLPNKVEFFVSEDGKEFTSLGVESTEMPNDHPIIGVTRFAKEIKGNYRYVKVVAIPFEALPVWHSGAGNAPWMFTDEIVVE